MIERGLRKFTPRASLRKAYAARLNKDVHFGGWAACSSSSNRPSVSSALSLSSDARGRHPYPDRKPIELVPHVAERGVIVPDSLGRQNPKNTKTRFWSFRNSDLRRIWRSADTRYAPYLPKRPAWAIASSIRCIA